MNEPWLVWMWHYGSLEVDQFETREAAMSYAEGVADEGAGSLEVIEGPSGIVTDAALDEFRAARREQEAAERTRRPVYTHVVEAKPPTSEKWAWFGTYSSADEAEVARAELAEVIGAARVRVEPIKP